MIIKETDAPDFACCRNPAEACVGASCMAWRRRKAFFMRLSGPSVTPAITPAERRPAMQRLLEERLNTNIKTIGHAVLWQGIVRWIALFEMLWLSLSYVDSWVNNVPVEIKQE